MTTLPDTAPMLQIEGLACRRGEKLLFRNLRFEIRPGEWVWLRGRNGSGKTSLLRLLTGLSRPEKGSVAFHSTLREIGATAEKAFLYIGHTNALKDDLSVIEALRFLAVIQGRAASAAALQGALGRFGMDGRRSALVRSLSQGQRRRVALARLALEEGGGLWLLDEPFDALDAEGAAQLHALLAEHCARGGAVLLAGHQPHGGGAPTARTLDLDRYAPAA